MQTRTVRSIYVIGALCIGLLCGTYLVVHYELAMVNGHPPYTDHDVYHHAANRCAQHPEQLYTDASPRYESGGTFNYPPPAVLPFMLLAPFGRTFSYVTASTLSLASSLALVFVSLLLMQRLRHNPIRKRHIILAVATWLCFAPVWQDAKHGQVNAFVCLCCVLSVLWTLQRRPFLAALCIVVGTWLKVYAVIMFVPIIPMLVAQAQHTKAMVDVRQALATLVWPMVLSIVVIVGALPWIPIELYRTYATIVLPSLSTYTGLNPLNQSLIGAYARLSTTSTDLATTAFVAIPGWVHTFQSVSILAISSVIARASWRQTHHVIKLSVFILAMIPILSSYGWEYTFIFCLPLTIMTVIDVLGESTANRMDVLLLCVALLAFAIPKPNDTMLHAMATSNMSWLVHVLTFRYMAAVCCLVVIQIFPRATRGDAQ
jgi:hypothetical protein